MRVFWVVFALATLVLVVACGGESRPTTDLQATIEAAIRTAQPTPTSTPTPDIEATVQARLQAILEAMLRSASTPTLRPTSGATATPIQTPTATSLPAPTATPTNTPGPTSTPLATPSPSHTPTTEGLLATVIRVIDGDTVEVMYTNGVSDKVRLLGIDSPEIFSENIPYEYGNITNTTCLAEWGQRTTEFAVNILEGKAVTLILDSLSGERDFFDRLLAYIVVDGQDFNASQIEQGYARVYTEGDSGRE